MKTKSVFAVWGGMFILCAGLGFIPEPDGLLKALCVLAAAVFFVMPGMLLYTFYKGRNVAALKKVTVLAAVSLGATLVLLLANLLAVTAPTWVGNVLYGALVILSSPMVCSRFWAVSLFCWACVLMVGITAWRKAKKEISQG